MSFLIKYQIKKNNINHTEFEVDTKYESSDINEDKIVNIRFNKSNFKNIVQLFKSKLLLNDLNIKTFINHIDRTEFYYIKDLFVDLTYPLNTEDKNRQLTKFYKQIFDELIGTKFNISNILMDTTIDVKKVIKSLTTTNKTTNNEKLLYIFTSKTKNIISNELNHLEQHLEPKTEIIENFLSHSFDSNFKQRITNQIVNIFKCTNDLDKGGSLIFRISELNSQKIEYTLSYLSEIYERVYLINSLSTNVIKEDFYLVCVDKKYESYLSGVPLIPFDYMPVNYTEISNIIYFIKIIRKKLINLYITIDHYMFIDGNEKQNYNKFESYYQKLLEIDEYKKYVELLKWVC